MELAGAEWRMLPSLTPHSFLLRGTNGSSPLLRHQSISPLPSVVEGEKALIVGAAPPSHISPVVLPGLHHGSAIETRGIPAAWRARDHPAWCGLATYAAKQGVQFCQPGHFSPYS